MKHYEEEQVKNLLMLQVVKTNGQLPYLAINPTNHTLEINDDDDDQQVMFSTNNNNNNTCLKQKRNEKREREKKTRHFI